STLWWEAQDKYYVDPQNIKDKEGNYDLFNLDLRYKIKAATLAFQVRNLFDEDYNGFVWNSAYGFSPGDPRSYYGYVMLEF
ncbi:MAG: TonB-dependent receptor, partial [Thermodesulfobacteriota bacterium]|nr:TonB-dependent receptor [Thermodesulfobacteriota bacterium]